MRNPRSFSRPGLQSHAGAFPILENPMKATTKAIARGFSMMELVIVVSILAIIAAIAVPRFADASSGRRLNAAKNTLLADVEMAKLRARATSSPHLIKFYPSENRYLIVEGTDVKREAIILTRDFDDNPYNLGIHRTDVGGDEILVITAFGDASPASRIQLIDGSVTIVVDIEGVGDPGVTPTLTIPIDEVIDLDIKVLGVSL